MHAIHNICKYGNRLQECGEGDVILIDKDFMSVIYTLVANGHEHLVDSVIPLLTKRTGFNQDATNLVLRLVSIGKLDIAYRQVLILFFHFFLLVVCYTLKNPVIK